MQHRWEVSENVKVVRGAVGNGDHGLDYGAVLSTITLVGQRRRDRLARERQARQDQLTMEEAQRRQAEQVTGWLVPDEGPQEPNELYYGLMLQNGSSQPVRQLIASVVTMQGSGRRTAVAEERRSDEEELHRSRYRVCVALLPPERRRPASETPVKA